MQLVHFIGSLFQGEAGRKSGRRLSGSQRKLSENDETHCCERDHSGMSHKQYEIKVSHQNDSLIIVIYDVKLVIVLF